MHIKKDDTGQELGEFVAWCGAKVDGFTRAYLTVDNALKAIEQRRGVYPCQECIIEVMKALGGAAAKELTP